LFFLGFCETLPGFTLGLIKPHWANLAMGFGIAWAMQLHMSYLVFIPFFLLSLYFQSRNKKLGSAAGFSFLGALPLLALLLPTYMEYGFNVGRDAQGFITGINWSNARDLFGTLARFCSMASFEMPRFIGDHTHEREMYLLNLPWLLVPGFFLWAAGFLQPVLMIGFCFVKRHPRADWKWVRGLGVGTFFLIYGLFLFSPDMAASFRLVLLYPVLFLYSFYCFDALRGNRWWYWLGIVFILFGVYFQAFYTFENARKTDSIYVQYRDRITQALQQNDYRIFSPRREGSLY
jgi:ABC-type multidrug transport system fused ATPase/permease subunit